MCIDFRLCYFAKYSELMKTWKMRIEFHGSFSIAFLAKLCGSGFQAKSFAIWLDNLEANRSITGIPIFWQVPFKYLLGQLPLQEVLVVKRKSVQVFKIPGRDSAVIAICFKSRYLQMPLLRDTLKTFETLKTKKKSVSSNVFWYVQVHIFWKCIQYTIYWDEKFYSDKIKRTKNALFSFSNSNLSQF